MVRKPRTPGSPVKVDSVLWASQGLAAIGVPVAAAAAILRCSEANVTAAIRAGHLKAQRLGNYLWLIDPESLAAYAHSPIRRRRSVAQPPRKPVKKPAVKKKPGTKRK